jgi:transposase-like protein
VAKHRRYSDKDKETALALFAVNGNIAYVAETSGVPESTIRSWIKTSNATDKPIAEIRAKKKAEFAEKCWKPITIGVALIERQMQTAYDKQDELDKLIDIVSDIKDEDMSYKMKQSIIRKIEKMARPDMRELTTAIGTLYDKQALAVGDSTANESIKIELAEELKEYAE